MKPLPDSCSCPTREPSFWDHLDALRSTLICAVLSVVVLSIIAAAFMPWIFDRVVLAPAHGIKLVNLELTAQVFIHMSAALWIGFIVAIPVISSLLWQFIAPALLPAEKRCAAFAAWGSALLFYTGVITGYFIIFPLTLRFLASYQLSAQIPNSFSITSYIDAFATVILGSGLLFQLPEICWALGKFGILKRGFFSRYRRHAVVALLTVSAIITPTTDPFTLLAVFFPAYLLWELGAMLVPRSRNAQNACATRKHEACGPQPDGGSPSGPIA